MVSSNKTPQVSIGLPVFNGEKYEVYVRDIKKFKEETKAKTTLENDTPAKFSYKYKILIAKKNNITTIKKSASHHFRVKRTS